jgi:hypothetical protein
VQGVRGIRSGVPPLSKKRGMAALCKTRGAGHLRDTDVLSFPVPD